MYTQNDMVLDYLKKYKSITQMEATNDLGITRLASRIADLKTAGVAIVSEFEHGKNRFGRPTRYKRYRLEEEAES